jgi:tetratricopeptide (TPR) repeat protein
MKRNHLTIAAILGALLAAPAVLPAAGGASKPEPPPVPEATPQQLAAAAYNEGLELRDRAWKLEEEAAAASGEKAAKKAKRAQKAFNQAIERFRAAVEGDPELFQAHSSLGYALRKTGRYEEALAAYDRALAIAPSYVEAIEYRGEAYLGLDRIEEAKGAYMQLFEMDRERAAELMTAMKRWVEQRRGDAGGLSEETIESFATWVEERSDLAAQVGTLASVGRSW